MLILDIRIERKKRELNKAVKIKGVMDKQTLKLSQQLDVLIVKRMSNAIL